MLCILARTAYRFKRYQIVIIPDNRIIAGNTYTACYYKSFGINPNNGNQMTPPTLVEPENDKIFERLHTARTAIPITFQQSLSSQTQHKRASIRPTRGLPSSYPVFFVFFLCLCGFPGSSGSGSGYLARRQSTKKALCRGGSTAQGFFGLLCCFGPQRWPR